MCWRLQHDNLICNASFSLLCISYQTDLPWTVWARRWPSKEVNILPLDPSCAPSKRYEVILLLCFFFLWCAILSIIYNVLLAMRCVCSFWAYWRQIETNIDRTICAILSFSNRCCAHVGLAVMSTGRDRPRPPLIEENILCVVGRSSKRRVCTFHPVFWMSEVKVVVNWVINITI